MWDPKERAAPAATDAASAAQRGAPTGRHFLQAATLNAKTHSFLPIPMDDPEHLSQGPSVQGPSPLQPCDTARGFLLVEFTEGEQPESLSAKLRFKPFLEAGCGLFLVLPGWLKNCQPAAHSVSWVCPESKWVFPGVSHWADIMSHKSRLQV